MWMLTLSAAWVWAEGTAPQAAVSETSVKAAFVYKFLSYIEWPAGMLEQEAPVTIGVLGAEQIATELRQIAAGRTVDARPIEVRILTRNEPLDGVHLLFVGEAARARLDLKARAGLHGKVVVTENNGALPDGSIINLVTAEGRVRFDVSLPAATQAGIKLSSRLLSVARTVEKEG
jgi:hypothetical protein